jgi:hypothetical protein
MSQETELKHRRSQGHLLKKTGFGETVDKVEGLTRFFESERHEIGVANLEKILYKRMKDV